MEDKAYNSRRYGFSYKRRLLNLLRNVRQTTDEMWQCYEMTCRTYSALVVMFPDQFPENYQQANKHVSFGPMHDWRSTFSTPTVFKGRVYMGTQTGISVFGLCTSCPH
jgi:hypothetical protein